MDQKFLKRLISECPLNNFTEDENSKERHKIFDDYLKEFTDSLYKDEDQIIMHLWRDNIVASETSWLLDSAMIRRCFLFFDCAAAIYNYTAKKVRQKKGSELAAHVSIQLQNDLRQYHSILILAMNGCFNSVIVEYRSLYESFIIGQYLVLNPDLVPIYNDHMQFSRYHLAQLVGNSNPEVDKKHDEYLNKYGADFEKDYGWTKSKIKNKNDRKIGTLAKACGLNDKYTALYKVASRYVHSSAVSVHTKTDITQIKVFFQAAMHFIVSEITDYMRESKLPTKDVVILRNILIFLDQDFKELQ